MAGSHSARARIAPRKVMTMFVLLRPTLSATNVGMIRPITLLILASVLVRIDEQAFTFQHSGLESCIWLEMDSYHMIRLAVECS